MEQADSYSSAVQLFSSNALINPIYYIVAGSSANEGAVVTRYREAEKTDVWPINTSAVDGWFRLVTNYDHWESDPTYDDRRTPGIMAQNLISRKPFLMLRFPQATFRCVNLALMG